jgi:DHA2 family multidrug resistance protein
VPIGIMATMGLLSFLPETQRSVSRFDWTGFVMLGLGIGAFQAMLDRGQQLDWFGSREIVLEACAAGIGFYCFIVHFLLAEQPLIAPRLLSDGNFVIATICIGLAGMSMYSTLALMSPYLQTLMGYPVLKAGFAMAPSGLGTMAAMFLCGRLPAVIAARTLVLFGFGIMICGLHLMSKFSPDSSELQIVTATFLQGASIGLIFVALSTVTFATLPASLRSQGAGLYSLVRNLGSSIGIAVTGGLLQRNIQVNHATISALVTPFNRMLQTGGVGPLWHTLQPADAAALDAVINQNAAAIAYSDDFKLLMIVAAIAAPIALLIRAKPLGPPDPAHTVMD